jgi:hypothetical protein
VARTTALLPYQVGPSWGQEFNQALTTLSGGGGRVNFTPGSSMFQLPDLNAIAEQATARTLANISPFAALRAGVPVPQVPQGLDVYGLLNQSNYGFAGPGGTPVVGVSAQPSTYRPLTPFDAGLGNLIPPLRGPISG